MRTMIKGCGLSLQSGAAEKNCSRRKKDMGTTANISVPIRDDISTDNTQPSVQRTLAAPSV